MNSYFKLFRTDKNIYLLVNTQDILITNNRYYGEAASFSYPELSRITNEKTHWVFPSREEATKFIREHSFKDLNKKYLNKSELFKITEHSILNKIKEYFKILHIATGKPLTTRCCWKPYELEDGEIAAICVKPSLIGPNSHSYLNYVLDEKIDCCFLSEREIKQIFNCFEFWEVRDKQPAFKCNIKEFEIHKIKVKK